MSSCSQLRGKKVYDILELNNCQDLKGKINNNFPIMSIKVDIQSNSIPHKFTVDKINA